MKFETPFGATPLDYDEKALLIPQHIQTMEELNAFEHANILQAERWAFGSRFNLSFSYVKKLHEKMFDQTWKWAGKYRTSEKNIGIQAYRIPIELESLLQDIKFQIEHTVFEFDEIAARFHHRLVLIHPFSNGNGRHARLMTDLLLIKNGFKRFTWGGLKERFPADERRKKYISALRRADHHEIKDLLQFVRS